MKSLKFKYLLNDLDPQFVERNSQYLYVVNAIHAVLLSMSIYQLSREIVFQRIQEETHLHRSCLTKVHNASNSI